MASGQTGLGTLGGGAGTRNDNPLMAPMAVLAIVSLAALAHPNPLVLPILSAILVTGALVVYCLRRVAARRRGVPAGDGMLLPALMLFFGFAAAIFSDSDRVAQSLAALAQ